MSDTPHTDMLVRDMRLARRIANKHTPECNRVAAAIVGAAFFTEIRAIGSRNVSIYNSLHEENS